MEIDLTRYELTTLIRAIQVGLRTPGIPPLDADEIEAATSGAKKLVAKFPETS